MEDLSSSMIDDNIDDSSSNIYTYCTSLFSFVILLFASWCVGEGGEILGEKYDASIIGGLVIAWLNTAPEAIFFITALQDDKAEFAVGAVSGSTIVVCTIAVGACLYCGSKARKEGSLYLQNSVKKQCIILASSILVASLLPIFGFNLFCGVSGVLFYCWFLYYSLVGSNTEFDHSHHHHHHHNHHSHHTHHDINKIGSDDDDVSKDNVDLEKTISKRIRPTNQNNNKTSSAGAQFNNKNHDHSYSSDSDSCSSDDEDSEEKNKTTMRGVLYLITGGILIIGFSGIFINSVVELAVIFNVSPTLLAFFLAPVASEAPEILESIQLSRKGKIPSINIAFSNLIGGTITKTTLLMGIFSFYGVFKEFEWISPNYSISIWLLILCSLTAAVVGGLPGKQTVKHAFILFSLFIICAFVQYFINSSSEQVDIAIQSVVA